MGTATVALAEFGAGFEAVNAEVIDTQLSEADEIEIVAPRQGG